VQSGDKTYDETAKLIEANANVNAVDPSTGNSILHVAQGRRTLTLLLKQPGIKTNVTNKLGITPAQTVMEFYVDHYFTLDGLAKVDETKSRANFNGVNFDENKDLFAMLTKNLELWQMEELIINFASNSRSQPLEWLLSLKTPGVDINASFEAPYDAALIKAAEAGLPKNVQLLLDNGADDYVYKASTYERALKLAEKGTTDGHKACYEILRSFDEKGPLGERGVKTAQIILQGDLASEERYEKLLPNERTAQNNLLFRFAAYSKEKGNDNAVKLVLKVLNERAADLTQEQQNATIKMGTATTYNLITPPTKFNEAKFRNNIITFIKLMNKDLRQFEESYFTEMRTEALAALGFKELAKVCNVGFFDFQKKKTLKDFYASYEAQILVDPNGLIGYLYNKALKATPANRTGEVLALDTLIILADNAVINTKESQNYDIQKAEIKSFISEEVKVDKILSGILEDGDRSTKAELRTAEKVFDSFAE
jgi:hypothetical protein